eukprot:CAMPEP_0116559720 /NCGR_PEP_ID=MMETSP0397-20121206/10564_1 /TAXON_ID=216820 /ORGANISM="Cyclophora tenuis, Strain ECT3854" /LENGTH=128 /DNA_ID=CAMNT_0004085543 /DNA_START=178 /DNA_END=561 /DNA_ORIENTATION=+
MRKVVVPLLLFSFLLLLLLHVVEAVDENRKGSKSKQKSKRSGGGGGGGGDTGGGGGGDTGGGGGGGCSITVPTLQYTQLALVRVVGDLTLATPGELFVLSQAFQQKYNELATARCANSGFHTVLTADL